MVDIPLKKYIGSTWEKLFPSMDDFNGLAGEGRTTETVKGNADAIAAHTEEDATDAHTIGNITGLTTALSNKASTTHDHDDAYAPQFSAITSLSTSTTLALSHAQKLLRCTSSSNRTITVPPNSSVEFPVGTEIEIVQFGTGTVTIAAGSNVTIRSKDSKLAIDGQYAGATLKKIDTNEWLLIGALK